jgi:membrane peptidoglycan carboxypeptidase
MDDVGPVLDLPLNLPRRLPILEKPTAALTSFSDWLCKPMVSRGARELAEAVSVPGHFIEMLLWVEDKRFLIHFGVDPLAMIRAMLFNVRGGVVQGASTISQQVYTIRWSNSGGVCRDWRYKAKQIPWSFVHSVLNRKRDILKEYLNTIYWGRSYFGIDHAARGYFNGTRQSLSVEQSFFLAERLAAPNRASAGRISRLLMRSPIKATLGSNGSSAGQVLSVYRYVYGSRGDLCRHQER